eukprot:1051730-Ditylum_brightwellii.AAC.1
MRVTTGINDEDNKLLEPPPQSHPDTRDHGDLLIPTQILPTKMTKAQRSINNSKHHRNTLDKKRKNRMQIYFQNINGIATEEDLKAYMEDMADKEIDIWGWAETN